MNDPSALSGISVYKEIKENSYRKKAKEKLESSAQSKCKLTTAKSTKISLLLRKRKPPPTKP
jgi:hypothetical protein